MKIDIFNRPKRLFSFACFVYIVCYFVDRLWWLLHEYSKLLKVKTFCNRWNIVVHLVTSFFPFLCLSSLTIQRKKIVSFFLIYEMCVWLSVCYFLLIAMLMLLLLGAIVKLPILLLGRTTLKECKSGWI